MGQGIQYLLDPLICGVSIEIACKDEIIFVVCVISERKKGHINIIKLQPLVIL